MPAGFQMSMQYGMGKRSQASGAGFEAEAVALFARFTTPPTDVRKSQINTLIKALKASGAWATFDALYVMAAADAQAAGLNWIQNLYNLTPVLAPVFTADRGYQGDGLVSRITTGFNPATAGGKFALNSAEQGIWSRTDVVSGNMWDVGNANSRFNARSTNGDTLRGQMNDGTIASLGAAGNSTGHIVLSRTGASVRTAYRNGASLGGDTTAATAFASADFALLSDGGVNFSTRQQAAAHFGSGLTGAQVLATYNALLAYMQAVGAA